MVILAPKRAWRQIPNSFSRKILFPVGLLRDLCALSLWSNAMKAAVVEAFKEPLKIWNDWPDPELGPDDVLVKVRANGICRSDWHLWQGHWDWMGFSPPLPAVLGHETAGEVE